MSLPASDPYAIRTFEQFLALLDNGDFLDQLTTAHQDMLAGLYAHFEEHGNVGCKGVITVKLGYEMNKLADVLMYGDLAVKEPKRPVAAAAAYTDDQGKLSLYSPLMRQRDNGVRDVTVDVQAVDVTPHDPETGEVRDVASGE